MCCCCLLGALLSCVLFDLCGLLMIMMCCHDGIIISLWCKGLNESCKTEELYAAAEGYRYRLHLVVDVDLSYI